MNLLNLSINHRTAPVEVREKVWLSEEETKLGLQRFRPSFFGECMVFSTCNRTEVFGVDPSADVTPERVRDMLLDLKQAGAMVSSDHFVSSFSEEAVRHLFEISAGIDSMVVGDIQILNQVKEAFKLARDEGALGPVLSRLMQSALRVGKRTRTETAICEGAVSVSYAAVELANKIFEDITTRSALLIGAGETGELTVKHLVGKGIGHIKIANRTRAKAEELVASLGGEVVDYELLVDALQEVDIVITSVRSPSYIVQPADVQRVMKQRLNNPLFLIDIGVPRNIDPAARKIDNVFLYDLDSLGGVVERNLGRRKAEIPKVSEIVKEEMADFFRWYNTLQVGPTIQELRDTFEAIRTQEVQKNINRFKPEDRELIELVTKRIVNKILHQPITTLKEQSGNGEPRRETIHRIHTLREIFGIGKPQERDDD
jgi:glutamyl-tRNA reductase